MSRNELLLHPGDRHHLVQFYGQASALAENIGRYFKAGADRGHALLLIATGQHAELFLETLQGLQVDGSQLLRQGRLRLLDADSTLGGLFVKGSLSWTRFDQSVGALVREMKQTSKSGGLQAYGEMVDLLWKQGRLSDVNTLEGYWNRLLASERISLFYSYTVELTDPRSGLLPCRQILSTHSQVIPSRTGAQHQRAVRRAMETVLGKERSEALWPLVRANVIVEVALPVAERTLLWFQRNLPGYAGEILKYARAYCVEESAGELQGGKGPL